MDRDLITRLTVLIFVFVISALFFSMISGLLLTLLMSALFTTIMRPLYNWLITKFRGKKSIAGLFTVLVFLLIVIVPITAFIGVIIDQAYSSAVTFAPWIKNNLASKEQFASWVYDIPYVSRIYPDHQSIIEAIGGTVDKLGHFVGNGLQGLTQRTASFFFQAFVFLYAMFFFLLDGEKYAEKMLYYIPLPKVEKDLMMRKFGSITSVTLKGSVIIGVIQGVVGGAAMWLAGMPNVFFWGLVIMVASVIPAIGPGIVLIPASIILMIQGDVITGLVLLVFSVAVVGTIDNFLRPVLVSKGAEMPDLLVFLSTVGGLAMFGLKGLIIGPIVAALFLSIWEIYGTTYQAVLTKTSAAEINDMIDQELNN